MRTWYKETYAVTAADAATTNVVRLWTPDGVNHDPGATGKLSKREDWKMDFLQVYVLSTGTGLIKHGLVGQLILGLDYPGGWTPIVSPYKGALHPNYGLIWRGGPVICTHGFGWWFLKGALADGDKIVTRALYEPIARGPQ